MHFSNIDAYFHMAAKGNREAYEKLYFLFTKKANRIIKIILSSNQNYTGIPEDFSEYVDKYFFKTLAEYDSERGSFSHFADYVLSMRFASKIQKAVINELTTYVSLDDEFDGNDPMECIEDPNQINLHTESVIENFKYELASNSKKISNETRIHRRILMMQYAGYTDIEIAKYLKMTPGELRGYIKRIHRSDDMINLKLELK